MSSMPYSDSPLPKKKQVALMFDRIAPRYDLLNHLLSFNIDKYWRRKAVSLFRGSRPRFILDVAAGTGDFALAALKAAPEKVTGVDISEEMLAAGREKLRRKGMDQRIELLYGDAENLPFGEASFDVVISGFGVRNFENTSAGIGEMYRVLGPEGQIVVLEFSRPRRTPFRQIYHLYFTRILPGIGRWISGDKSAYTYLPGSVGQFPDGEEFLALLRAAGFTRCQAYPLTFGIATIYTGIKNYTPGSPTPADPNLTTQ